MYSYCFTVADNNYFADIFILDIFFSTRTDSLITCKSIVGLCTTVCSTEEECKTLQVNPRHGNRADDYDYDHICLARLEQDVPGEGHRGRRNRLQCAGWLSHPAASDMDHSAVLDADGSDDEDIYTLISTEHCKSARCRMPFLVID